MVIEPRVRGFICTAAHPKGCYQSVKNQIDYVKAQGKFAGPKSVLVLGGSTGYGLASSIVSAFGANAKVLGVAFEKPASDKRTASAGWYNLAALEDIAEQDGLLVRSINGDAFSDEVKQQAIAMIKQEFGQIDLVIYSLASPRRLHPKTGEVHKACLKAVDKTFSGKSVDPITSTIKEVTIEPATDEEVANTVAVMGGEDWEMWIDTLMENGVLADHAMTVAYSYIGPGITHDIYTNGTIGRAKAHLHATANKLNSKMSGLKGKAFISVNKALVTQASSAIPVVPLYMSILFKIMKAKGTHENSIQQIYRLFSEYLYADDLELDENGLIRIDDLEMQPDVQQEIIELWPKITSENIEELTDIKGYRNDFYQLFGFNFNEVDYKADVDPDVKIKSLVEA